MKSSKGKNVLKFADALVTSQVQEVGSFSDYVNQQINFYFEERRKMSLHKLWRNFHVLRLSENLKSKYFFKGNGACVQEALGCPYSSS